MAYGLKHATLTGSGVGWRYGYHNRYRVGDPGLLGAIGGLVKKVAPKFLGAIPGVGTALTIGSIVGKPALGLAQRVIPGVGRMMGGAKAVAPTTSALVPYNAQFAASQLARSTGGRLGGKALVAGGAAAAAGGYMAGRAGRATGKRYRRMNALNPKAASRAIRRIKAVRKVCRTIESQLPKRACKCATRGYSFARKRRAA